MARCIQPVCVATYHPIVDAPVSLRKLRRVSMVPPPWVQRLAASSLVRRVARRTLEVSWVGIQGGHGEAPGSCHHPATQRHRGVPGPATATGSP